MSRMDQVGTKCISRLESPAMMALGMCDLSTGKSTIEPFPIL